MSSPAAPDRPRLPWDPPEHFEKKVPEGDNRERLICNRCDFIHYQNPKVVAGAVCTWGDKILLAKRAIEPRKGFWTLPAGDRKSTRLNSSHIPLSRMPSSA